MNWEIKGWNIVFVSVCDSETTEEETKSKETECRVSTSEPMKEGLGNTDEECCFSTIM